MICGVVLLHSKCAPVKSDVCREREQKVYEALWELAAMVRFKLILSTVPSDNELNQHALWICTEWDTHTDTHTSDIYGDTGGKDKVWHWLFMSRSPQNQKLSLCHSTISLSSKFLSPGVSKVTKQLKVTKLIYLSLVCSVHYISFLTKHFQSQI